MPYVIASEAIANALKAEGYNEVPLRECHVLDQQFKLGVNIRFFIDKNDSLQEINVWQTRDLSNADVVYFSFAGHLGEKAPIKLKIEEGRSLCSLFRAMVAPGSASFQNYLTLWTKGGGIFGKPIVAALVYHCPVARTVSGSYSTYYDDQGVLHTRPPPKEDGPSKLKVLGGTVLLVSVAGLLYLLWKKNRDMKRKKENKIQLLNAIADTLPDEPKSAPKSQKKK